MNEGDPIEFI